MILFHRISSKLLTNAMNMSGILVFAMFTVSSSSVFAQGAHLQHIQPVQAEVGVPIQITATVEGSAQLPTEGRIYFRMDGDDAFAYAEMRVDRYNLSGEIPGTSILGGEVLYYLWTELNDGASLTLPTGTPYSNDFFRIHVQTTSKVVSGLKDSFVILSPAPGSTMPEGEMVIAVSILKTDSIIDYTRIVVMFDGKDFTRSAKISEDLIVLPLPAVRPGPHIIALMLDRDGKKQNVLTWSFKGPIIKSSHLERGPVAANITSGVGYESFSNQTRKMGFLDAVVNGSLGKMNWAGKAYVTSYESKYLQPQDRFMGMIQYGAAKLKVGDTQPRFSEFSLWGVRTRGVEANYHGYAFNLDVTQGEIVRGIEGTFRSDTTFVIDDATGDTLKSLLNPALDSIIVESVTNQSGRYRRNILAVRPGLPLSDYTTLSFNIVKAKDDVKSIDWGKNPKDNLVLGFDLNVIAARRRVIFYSETAVSLYNSDISGGAMEDAKAVESIIIVNQFFDPLPTDSTILEGGVDQMVLAKKLFSELTKSSLAHRTNLTLNFFHNELKLGYKTIGRSFHSLGSPTILTDVSGFSVEDRLRLLNSRLYLTLAYEGYADNVNGRNATTADKNIMRAGIAYYSPPNYPNLNVGYRIYNRKNDGVQTVNVLPDGVIFITDTRVDNTQNQMNLSIDESFRWAGFDNLIAIGYTAALTEDEINPALATDLSSMNLTLQARRQPWEWNSSIGLTSQSAQNGALVVDYTSINLGGKYNLIPNKLWVTAGISESMGDGGNDALTPYDSTRDTPKVYHVEFNRMDISGSIQYQYNLHHSVSLSAYTANHSDEGYSEMWGGTRSYNKDSATFVSQNDKSVRLTYNFKI